MFANVFIFVSFVLLVASVSYFVVYLAMPRKLKVPLMAVSGVGIFLATFFLFVPINLDNFAEHALRIFKTILISIYNTIAVFTANSDYSGLYEYTATITNPTLLNFYRVVSSILYVVAPVTTFGIVLSFFKNVKAGINYALSFHKNVYIFSELNSKTILLAEDIREKEKRSTIVFTGVTEELKEKDDELFDRADVMKCILFKSDLTSLKFKHHVKNKQIRVFIMNENEDEAVTLYDYIFKALIDNENASIYFKSGSAQGKLAINRTNIPHKVKVFRVNYDTLFIYNYLHDHGFDLFDTAKYDEKLGKKVISVLIFGVGRYGTQLLKALCWYCQMDGYYLKITAIDGDEHLYSRLASEAPELFDEEHNKKDIPGDAQYYIDVYQGVKNHTMEFDEIVKNVKDCTMAFACTGQDESNIDAALNLRMLFERAGIHPVINAIISGDRAGMFQNATNFRGQPYDITYMGDYKSSYSMSTIINSGIEQKGLEIHKRYGEEEAFWLYEYNYRSSCASAIHLEAKIHCGIPGAGAEEGTLTPEEKVNLQCLEHKRWNAWMRGEGYVYTDIKDKVATSIGKMHFDIVPFANLDDAEKEKDSRVNTKKKK